MQSEPSLFVVRSLVVDALPISSRFKDPIDLHEPTPERVARRADNL